MLFWVVGGLMFQVYEVVPCVSDCSQYIWVAEPWSVWKVSNVDLKENCGEGVQTRRVRWDAFSSYLLYCYSIHNTLIILCSSLMVLQVYVEHSGRPQWWGGRLSVWSRGDASGHEGEPTALPGGLCAVRLESLDPMWRGQDYR